MLRLIIFIILLRLIWLVVKPILLNKLHKKANSFRFNNNYAKTRASSNHSSSRQSQALIKCDICNTYFPQEDAIEINGKSFCCKEHAEQSKH